MLGVAIELQTLGLYEAGGYLGQTGLHPYLPRHRTVDEGRFVLFEFFNFGLLAGDGGGDLGGFSVKELGDAGLYGSHKSNFSLHI